MNRMLRRTLLAFTLAPSLATAVAAKEPAARSAAPKNASASDVPLVFFQGIDKRLTLLDADNHKLRSSMHEVQNVRSGRRRKQMVRQLQHSRRERERLRAVNQLLTISARAERRYRNQRQTYGAKLFRDFQRKVSPVKSAILHAQTAPTVSSWTRDEKLVNTRLLSVIAQFQAISGGYVALACHPGAWACCQPRVVRDGNSLVRGCAWSCTSRLTACRGGCLGPRTPNTVVAVKNTPKLPVFAKSTRLAATVKTKGPVNAPAVRQGSTSGR